MSDTTQEKQWYIAREGQQHGPLSEPEMQLFVKGGYLKPSDLVWRPGFSDWQSALKVFPPKSAETPSQPKTAAATTSATENLSVHAPLKRVRGASTSTPGTKNAPGTKGSKTGEFLQPSATGMPKKAASRADNPTAAASKTTQPNFPSRTASSDGKANKDRPTGAMAPQQSASSPAGGRSFHPVYPGMGSDKETRHVLQNTGHPVAPGQKQAHAPVKTQAQAFGRGQHSAVKMPQTVGGGTGPSLQAGTGPTFSQSVQPERTAPPAQPANGDENTFGFDSRSTSSMLSRVITTLAAIIFVGGGAMFAYYNFEQLSDIARAMMGSPSGQASNKSPPVIEANKKTKTTTLSPTKSAPDIEPSSSAKGASGAGASQPVQEETLASLDTQFQKSALWSLLKSEYPDWYNARLKQVLDLNAAGDDPEVTKRLLTEIVALRRKHAKEALSASADKLLAMATAFLANLKGLASHSTDACYMFISKGELSPTVLELMTQKSLAPALETQATTVFEAISEGRKSPVKRERASIQDYKILSQQLTKMGWTPQDLQLFSNPTALSNAPPSKVCQMVQDWFSAHIAITDRAAQERLLFETLRPVVAG